MLVKLFGLKLLASRNHALVGEYWSLRLLTVVGFKRIGAAFDEDQISAL